LDYVTVQFTQRAKTKAGKKSPGDFRLWTQMVTSWLVRRTVSPALATEIYRRGWYNLSTDEIVGGPGAGHFRDYVQVLHGIESVNLICQRFAAGETITEENAFSTQPQSFTMENTAGAIGPFWNNLPAWKQEQIDEITTLAQAGFAGAGFDQFARGVGTGLLLKDLTYQLEKKGQRRFNPTQGRHPTKLRGSVLTQVFRDGIGLVENLSPAVRSRVILPKNLLAFVQGRETESIEEAFNTGLVTGMAYIPNGKKQPQSTENQVEQTA
jgi:hypothetical protein